MRKAGLGAGAALALAGAGLLAACAGPSQPGAPAAAAAGAAVAAVPQPPPPALRPLERTPPTPRAEPASRVEPVLADSRTDPDEESAAPGAEFERGGASWYGSRFQNRRTASGERFDMKDLTAAHRSLPFGTLVCVRNLANDRMALVRVNDRGPSSRRRVIDVSQAAAEELGMVGLGVQTVALSRPVSGQERCE